MLFRYRPTDRASNQSCLGNPLFCNQILVAYVRDKVIVSAYFSYFLLL